MVTVNLSGPGPPEHTEGFYRPPGLPSLTDDRERDGVDPGDVVLRDG